MSPTWIRVEVPPWRANNTMVKWIAPTVETNPPNLRQCILYGEWDWNDNPVSLWIPKRQDYGRPCISNYLPPLFYKSKIIRNSVAWFQISNIDPQEFMQLLAEDPAEYHQFVERKSIE